MDFLQPVEITGTQRVTKYSKKITKMSKHLKEISKEAEEKLIEAKKTDSIIGI